MNDDETELRTDQGENDCDGGDACKAIEVQNLPLVGGPWPDPARLRTEQLRMELETVYAALGLSLTSSTPDRVMKLAADLWDLLGKPEKASVLKADAPTPLALLDLCRGVHRNSDGPHDPLWLVIARNAMAGRKIASTTTETKPSTATVDSVTETIRRMVRESVKVATIDPLVVFPIPPATFTRGLGGEPMLTLTVHKSRSVPLEIADINRAEGEPAADSADLFTSTLEHEAEVSGAAESEPEPSDDEDNEDGCYRCEGEERFEGDICDGCGSVADGEGGTVTPTGPYAEHLAIVESWRMADPPPTVPSGEVLNVEPAAVLNASVDGVTRAFSVHPSVLNTLNPSDLEGW